MTKVRKGRGLEFVTTRQVEPGEELCISYGHVEGMSLEERQKELEAVANPIMQKLYSSAGGAPGGFPGGAPGGFPGGAPGGFPGAGGAGAEEGPSVEEVD